MKNNRIFTVKYLAPTNTKGSRVSITESRFNKTDKKVLPYDYSFNNAREIAVNYLEGLGLNLVGFGETKDSYIILCDSWAGEHGFINILGTKEI